MKQLSLDAIEERAKALGNKRILALAAQMRKLESQRKRKLHVGDGLPPIGSDIYVGSSWYIDRGEDDICGGRAEVKEVEDGMVTVVEVPGSSFNWEYLKTHQEKLRKEYKNARAHPCPDV